jgi:hypothetical protein
MRTSPYLVILMVLACITGCTSTPAQPSVPAIAPATVSAIAADTGLPSLSSKTLSLEGKFSSGTGQFTVATVDGGRLLLPMNTLEVTARELYALNASTLNFSAVYSGTSVPLNYRVGLNKEPQHVLVFFPSIASMGSLADDVTHDGGILSGVLSTARSNGGYTLHLPESKGTYIGSFLGDRQADVLYGVSGTSISEAAAYVELCQNILMVEPAPSMVASLEAAPDWSSISAAARASELQRFAAFGQEVECNSLGAALEFARKGVPYATYRAIALTAQMGAYAPVILPLVLYSLKTYTAFGQ